MNFEQHRRERVEALASQVANVKDGDAVFLTADLPGKKKWVLVHSLPEPTVLEFLTVETLVLYLTHRLPDQPWTVNSVYNWSRGRPAKRLQAAVQDELGEAYVHKITN